MNDRVQTPAERAAQGAVVLQHPSANQERDSPALPAELDWEVLEERGEPPARDWAIDHWLGMGHVTLLAGSGGIGKSIAAQQIGTALALGQPFIAAIKQARVVLMWCAEDDHDEIWRRQIAICRRFSVRLGELRGRLHVEPMATVDCSLMEQVQGEVVVTSMLNELAEQISRFKAEVVILDNASRLFGGSENDRHQVSRFIAGLNRGAAATGAAVLLLGHVAKVKDSEYSGSTAWETAARGRLWMTDHHPDRKDTDQDEDSEVVTDLRYICKRKVNYSSKDIATLRYVPDGEAGSYELVEAHPQRPSGLINAIDSEHAKRIILACLKKFQTMGIDPVESRSSQHYLPKLIVGHSLNEGFSRNDLTRAMRSCMLEGKLKKGQIGAYANRTPRFGLIQCDPSAPPTPPLPAQA